MNHVWRVWRGAESFVLKVAPPHVAAAPEIPMSPGRLSFEAWALEQGFHGEGVRAPRLVDRGEDWLLMEDLGDLPSLDQALLAGRVDLAPLGRFLRTLHTRTGPDNSAVQQTRLQVQYAPLGLQDFGERLCSSGEHLIHGDLWPRSVLVGEGELLLIDWEFCHHGRACQDLGHLLAHLWMLEHTHGVGAEGRRSFLAGYGLDQLSQDIHTHMGAEILVRAGGPFKRGYLYQDSPLAAEAEAHAESLLSRARRSP